MDAALLSSWELDYKSAALPSAPQIPARFDLRCTLLEEETFELCQAVNDMDSVEIMAALTYVLAGTVLESALSSQFSTQQVSLSTPSQMKRSLRFYLG
eukprot:905403-Amphidinium_carterae.1